MTRTGPLLALVLASAACASAQSGDPDARRGPDARKAEIDADPAQPDAAPPPIDAAPLPIDAAPPPIDAAPPTIDAALGPPDTCAQARPLVSGVGVTGTTMGLVNDVQPLGACTGYVPDGPDAVYTINAAAGQRITATVTPTPTGWDTSVYITATCTMTPTCLDGADDSAGSGAETATVIAPTAGTYYVVVDGWEIPAFGPYSLVVTVQ